MTPVWRVASVAVALAAGFLIPLLALFIFLGVAKLGALAVLGLLALGGAVTVVVLVTRGRLRF